MLGGTLVGQVRSFRSILVPTRGDLVPPLTDCPRQTLASWLQLRSQPVGLPMSHWQRQVAMCDCNGHFSPCWGRLRLFWGLRRSTWPLRRQPTRSWTAHSHLRQATESLQRDCWSSLQQPEASSTPQKQQSPRSMRLSLFNDPLRRQRLLLLCLVCTLREKLKQSKRRRLQQCRSPGVCLLSSLIPLPWCGASDQAEEGKLM